MFTLNKNNSFKFQIFVIIVQQNLNLNKLDTLFWKLNDCHCQSFSLNLFMLSTFSISFKTIKNEQHL